MMATARGSNDNDSDSDADLAALAIVVIAPSRTRLHNASVIVVVPSRLGTQPCIERSAPGLERERDRQGGIGAAVAAALGAPAADRRARARRVPRRCHPDRRQRAARADRVRAAGCRRVAPHRGSGAAAAAGWRAGGVLLPQRAALGHGGRRGRAPGPARRQLLGLVPRLELGAAHHRQRYSTTS